MPMGIAAAVPFFCRGSAAPGACCRTCVAAGELSRPAIRAKFQKVMAGSDTPNKMISRKKHPGIPINGPGCQRNSSPFKGEVGRGMGAKGPISSLPRNPIPSLSRPIANVAGAIFPLKGRERVPTSGMRIAENHLIKALTVPLPCRAHSGLHAGIARWARSKPREFPVSPTDPLYALPQAGEGRFVSRWRDFPGKTSRHPAV